jgi:hypothetical protein
LPKFRTPLRVGLSHLSGREHLRKEFRLIPEKNIGQACHVFSAHQRSKSRSPVFLHQSHRISSVTMAEALAGLGAAVSVITVIQISEQVVTACIQYFRTAKDAEKDIQAIINVVGGVKMTLKI